MINATDPLNNPIPVSLVFNPKIIPIKNSANKITLILSGALFIEGPLPCTHHLQSHKSDFEMSRDDGVK